MMTADCELPQEVCRPASIEDLAARSSFGATRHDVELDKLIPFFAQNSPFIWLGMEPFELLIENPEDNELRYAPGYSDPNDSICIDFLADAVALERAGDLRGSLAVIYRRIDEMTKLGLIEVLDEELTSVPAEEISTDVLLGLLTATLPVKSQLPSRPALYKATKSLLKSRGHYEPGILDGLK